MLVRTALVLAIGLCAAAQTPVSIPFKLNCGSSAAVPTGYLADDASYITSVHGFPFLGGDVTTTPPGAANAVVYKTERVSSGTLTYEIPVPAGNYNVKLMFSEAYFNAANKRKFNIALNGEVKETELDIFATVGRDVALDFNYANVASNADDKIVVSLTNVLEMGIINGIVIEAGTPTPTVTPVPTLGLPPPTGLPACSTGNTGNVLKMNAGGGALAAIGYTADETSLISGPIGLTYTSPGTIMVEAGADNAEVYKTERYGSVTYNIPVTEAGLYVVQTLHSEGFHGAAGLRKFDVLVQGDVTNADVDVFEATGAKDKTLILTNSVTMAGPGDIVVKFVSKIDNAQVNGLIVDGCTCVGAACVPPTPTGTPTPSTTATPPAPTCPTDASTEISILRTNAGGPALADIGFTADDPSLVVSVPKGNQYMGGPLMGTDPLALVYKTERWSPQTLTYRVAVPAAGTYIVRTYHSEGFFNEESKRVFHLDIEGTRTNANVDVFAASGGMDKPLVLTNSVVVTGTAPSIEIRFVKVLQNPAVNGISIARCTNGDTPAPLPACSTGTTGVVKQLNAGGPELSSINYDADDVSLIIGSAGNTYISGPLMDTTPANAEVFRTERFTFGQSVEYSIPVPAAGLYTVDTLLSEGFQNGPGERVQNLEIDGTVTNANVDIFAAAGGKNKPLTLTNSVTKAAAGDKISVKVDRVTSNPTLNGIRIVGCTCLPADCPTPTMTPSIEPTPSTSPSPGAPAPAAAVMMNVGGPAIPAEGYMADNTARIVGPVGLTYPSSAEVTVPGGHSMQVYKTERYAQGTTLTYKFPLTPGTYMVETMHAESFFNEANKRKFGIKINGITFETGIDLAGTVGKNVAVVKKFNGIQTDGDDSITIQFVNELENPLVNGIRISSSSAPPTPAPSSSPGAPVPTGDILKLNVGGGAVDGYVADNPSYITSTSNMATNDNPITGATDVEIYKTERYTFGPSLDITLPVPAGGPYTVTLQFAETFFDASGVRKFGIEIQGTEVKAELDVFAEAGGMNKALVLNYPNITPNGSNMILIKLTDIMREPMINGIMVSSQSS